MLVRFTALVALGFVFALCSVAPAYAHAELASASPGPGTTLPQAPGFVQIEFTEPLNRAASSIRVLDGQGRDHADDASRGAPGDTRGLRRALGVLQPGVYTVRWTSTSTLDGHTRRGSYEFGIGASASAEQTVREGPVDSEGVGGIGGRWLALIGLALWLGGAILSTRVRTADLETRPVRAVALLAPGFVFLGTATSVASSALVARGSFGAIGDVLIHGRSGHLRLVVLGVSAVGCVVAWRRMTNAWLILVLASVAALADAASGHGGSASMPVVATIAFAAHLAAVGVWLFALVTALSAGRRIVPALNALAAPAITAAVFVLLTGTLSAIVELSTPSDLVNTGYGQVLLAKASVLALMATLGALHLRARHARPAREQRVRRIASSEVVAGAVAVFLAAILVGYPNPTREEAERESASHLDVGLTGEQGARALSLADASGADIVALTVTPPRPGPAQLAVKVVGNDAAGVRDAVVRGTSERGARFSTTLTAACGPGCLAGLSDIPLAERHGRDWLGIELNPAYADAARDRIAAARQPRTNNERDAEMPMAA